MTLLKPWFWLQSQTSFGRMYTRKDSFDFATKLKIYPQNLMLGFGPKTYGKYVKVLTTRLLGQLWK